MSGTVREMKRVTRSILRLGPADHGMPISLEEFEQADGEEGHRYEIIEGRVYVSPLPELPHEDLEHWLFIKLLDYGKAHPQYVQRVSNQARIFVPERRLATCPEPDIAVYRKYPLRMARWMRSWRMVSPVNVVEVLSPGNVDKDLERNVELYLGVPSIREYWIVDQRVKQEHPSMIVYRRRGSRWQKPIHVAPGGTYTTPLLPEFELKLDESDA